MRIACPGFVDLQVNGFAGVDFNSPGQRPEDMSAAIGAIRATGVTRFLPTLITSSFDRFAECARQILACEDTAIAGLHMEGPYISAEDGARGAHPVVHVRPASVDDFRRRQDAARGRIRLVTLAPEVPGALPLIEHLAETGVCVAIGHTAATAGAIADAVRAGARLSTHLGNACPATVHRHHNVIWEQMAIDALSASVIADGHHLPAAVLKSIVRAKGPGRAVLVTDAIAAAAAPAGRYHVGDLEVERTTDGRVALPGTPYLAGSSLTMDAAIGNAVRDSGIAIDEALAMASTQPARLIGIEPTGTVEADWDAAACRLTVRRMQA